MNPYQNYKIMYSSYNRMGEGDTLRSFLGKGKDEFFPLSISHGVDFGHFYGLMDENRFEPVHWAYNDIIRKKSVGGKPIVSLPHPWAMLASQRPAVRGRGTLIVGPPPGPQNDATLYSLIEDKVKNDECCVLVKPRGAYQASCDFWAQKGVKSVSVGGATSDFYLNLLEILEGFDRVVGCTFSSALIFAASIGKRVDIVRGFSYEFYDAGDYLERVNFQSEDARKVVREFVFGSYEKKIGLARSLLGFDLLDDKTILEDRVRKALADAFPVWLGSDMTIYRRLLVELARLLRRPGLARLSPQLLIATILGRPVQRVSVIRMNELDVWLDGVNDRAFSIRAVPFRKGVTVPGLAVDQYSG